MLGGYRKNFNLMLTGRIIYGLGGECMTVAQSTITANWFKGKELNLAMGANLALARLGAVLAGVVVPAVYNDGGLGNAFAVGFGICIFSFFNAIGIVYMDRAAEKEEGSENKVSDEDKFQWSDLKNLGCEFWILTMSCMLTYMSVFPYNQISSKLMQLKYSFSEQQASTLYTIPYLISAIITPFLGLLVDRTGRRVLYMITSSVLLVGAYSMSMTFPACDKCLNEMAPLLLSGVGYSIYASVIWGSIPYTVDPNAVGTAFGMVTAVQNLG
jgi:MFS family permease